MAVATDIQQQVFDLLSRASNVSFVSAEKEAGGLSALAPGQRVSAEVLATLANNRVQVKVGIERFNLDLPMTVRVGQMLEMTFVSAAPRSTFAIARQSESAPPVSLSDASRLLSLLVSGEQAGDSAFRSSLRNISDMLRRASGETGVLANLMDEALTYGTLSEGRKPTMPSVGDLPQERAVPQGNSRLTPEQARLMTFETNAAQILRTIAQNSRFILVEAKNQPLTPLPFLPGQEVEAAVTGTLPGGRTFVQVAGTALELALPRSLQTGDILRLTYIAAQPKPTFAIPRTLPDSASGVLSEAGRWLSVLEHSEGGVSKQQMYVLERLNTVLKNLPPDSPAFTAILDEAITYQTVRRTQHSAEQSATAPPSPSLPLPLQLPVTAGNGIVLGDDMAKLLQAVIKGNRLALLEALNQQAMPTGLMPGQQLRGEVLAALGGGRFMVQVAEQRLEFMLPKGISRGDMITLFFIAEEPRQTFLMARFGRQGDSKVSDTGRWLSGFLGETSHRLPVATTLGMLRALLPEPPADATSLGRALQQGLRESGLFYESHLARWFGGSYPLEDLLREPQGRLSPRLPQRDVHTALLVDELPLPTAARSGSTDIMESLFKKSGGMAHDGIADHRSLTLVNEQLSTLQNGQLLFRGELFPGQPMEWTVAEREAGRDQEGNRERNWETSVSVTLPHLGPVTALLKFDGTHVALKISAENSETAAILEAGKSRLTEQLEGAGLAPAEMSVSHGAA